MQPHLAKSDGCAAGVNVRGHLRLATAHGLSHSTNSAAACAPTHNAYAPCVTGACVRSAEGEGHSIRFICAHKTKRTQHATQRPLPPPPARQLNACTAATARRRAKWKYVISARLRLQPSRLLPAIHVMCAALNLSFSIKAQQKINHAAKCSGITVSQRRQPLRQIMTCNKFSACGPEAGALRREWQRALDFLHAIGSRELEGSLHVVLAPLALHHTSAPHAQQSRDTASTLA